jgi:antitoxin PrlF
MKKDADDAETAVISSSEKVILDLLERDIAAHPERLQPVTADQVRRVQSLVGDVSVELDTPLPPDDA